MTRKTLEHAYGFDDVAIVPGAVTTNPEMVSTEFHLGEHTFPVPILASSMGFIDGSVLSIATPAIRADLGAELALMLREGDVLLTLGAGDITLVGPEVLRRREFP